MKITIYLNNQIIERTEANKVRIALKIYSLLKREKSIKSLTFKITTT